MAASCLLQTFSVFLLTMSCVTFVSADDVYVMTNTSYGTLRGWVDNSPSVPVAKYFGIPFAKAPTGSLRFMPPVSPDKWNGVKDALKFGNECTQAYNPAARFNNGDDPPTFGEDCLFLNVYTSSQGPTQ